MKKGDQNLQVKNKQANDKQITSEQLLREAIERKEREYNPPIQHIQSIEELDHFLLSKRKQFEDSIRRNSSNVSTWLKYAKFEEDQNNLFNNNNLKRSRSIYERALINNSQEPKIYLNYAEMEMRSKKINRARNIFERAIERMPRVDAFWLKYIYFEEIIGAFVAVRQIFERWMEWNPHPLAWNSFINFEIRNKEYERVRSIYYRFVQCHPRSRSFIRWAKFECKFGEIKYAREVYSKAAEYLIGIPRDFEELLIHFADFEKMLKEFERAREIYRYGLNHLPKNFSRSIHYQYEKFEKLHGDMKMIEDAILNKRRVHYEEEIFRNPHNYDIWFDYIRMEEIAGDRDKIRELYERAIAKIPPANHEKRLWKRYIFFWIYYALFEEIECKNIEKCREIFNECIKVIPHHLFSFSKIWLMFAQFEIRQREIEKARLIFGNAIGKAPKQKIFIEYLRFEIQLGNIDRVRCIYEKWIVFSPQDCIAWKGYALFEDQLRETDRALQIFEMAINQPVLDKPELVWKSFIDFAIGKDDYDLVRSLYNQLLERTEHYKVWISFAQFEESIGELERAREVYERAYSSLKNCTVKTDRLLTAESLYQFEEKYGSPDQIAIAKHKIPKRVLNRRIMNTENGSSLGIEEYIDYIFPDDHFAPTLKVLDIAHQWKKQKIDNSIE